MLPLDLHVLGLPLAFILSQDQTLHRCLINVFRQRPRTIPAPSLDSNSSIYMERKQNRPKYAVFTIFQ